MLEWFLIGFYLPKNVLIFFLKLMAFFIGIASSIFVGGLAVFSTILIFLVIYLTLIEIRIKGKKLGDHLMEWWVQNTEARNPK